MPRTFFPPVQDRLVYPLIVLSAKRKVVLIPHKCLRVFEARIHHCLDEVYRFFRAVKHIHGCTFFEICLRSLIKTQKELIKLVFGEIVVCDVSVFTVYRSAVVHIIRRIGYHNIGILVFQDLCHIFLLGAIATKQSMLSKYP